MAKAKKQYSIVRQKEELKKFCLIRRIRPTEMALWPQQMPRGKSMPGPFGASEKKEIIFKLPVLVCSAPNKLLPIACPRWLLCKGQES